MSCGQDPLQRRLRKSTAGYKTMGEVHLDDEKPGQMGSPTRSNHQNLAVRPLRRDNSPNGGGIWVGLEPILRLSGKCRPRRRLRLPPRGFATKVRHNSLSNKEKQIWVIREKKTKAGRNNRKRPSLVQRKNENKKKKRRNKCSVILFVCNFLLRLKKGPPPGREKGRTIGWRQLRGAPWGLWNWASALHANSSDAI